MVISGGGVQFVILWCAAGGAVPEVADDGAAGVLEIYPFIDPFAIFNSRSGLEGNSRA